MAMAFLIWLLDRFDSIMWALDAAQIYKDKLSLEVVQNRWYREKQSHGQHGHDALKALKPAAFLVKELPKFKRYTSPEICLHCWKHRDSSLCFKKYPYLAPVGHPARTRLDKAHAGGKGLAASREDIIEEESKDLVFLLNFSEEPNLAHSNNPLFVVVTDSV